jgi:hypothetical protein
MTLYELDRSKQKGKWKTDAMNNFAKRYYIGSNVEGSELFCLLSGTKVAVYEDIWYIIHQTHQELGHQRNPRAHYDHINSLWYGITERAIKIYIDMCPICLQYSRTLKTE